MQTQSLEAIKETLSRALDARFDELIRDTQKLISFQTVSGGNPDQEAKYQQQIPACLAWLKELAESNGLRFHQWENEVAEIEWALPPDNGERRPVFGIASHIDVVTPVGNWSHPPFAAEIADGILYGRGIQDDKGPLMQSLYGLLAVKDAGIKPPCDVRIIIGTREETGSWSDIELYLKERGAPDFGFTPDADFPIITGEKGMMNLIVSAEWPKSAPHEETQMEFVSLNGGERNNIVPALTEVVLRFPVENKTEALKEIVRETTRFTVENEGANVTLVPNNDKATVDAGYYEALVSFIGKAAHSSTPRAGHNAIVDALRFFCDIETLPLPVRQFIQFLYFAAGQSDGSGLGVDSRHDFVGETTCVISILKIGQTGGEATINIRPTMGLPAREAIERARNAAAQFTTATGFQLNVSNRGKVLDAIFLDPEKPGIGEFLAGLRAAYAAVLGEECKLLSIGGTTYAKAFPNFCAFGPVLPGVDQELAHQADERLAVESIRRNALIYGLSVALMGKT